MMTDFSDSRKKMEVALKNRIIPILREKGFKGSFPHLRRFLDKEIHMITFQFDWYGGGFTINIGKCPSGGITLRYMDGTTRFIPPQKVNCYCDPGNAKIERLTMLSRKEDHWYRYDQTNDPGIYEKLVSEALNDLRKADEWWKTEQLDERVSK